MHMTHVAEVCTEHTIIILRLIGSNGLENEGAPVVDELASQLWQYKEYVSSSLILAVEKLSREVQQLK